MAGEAAVGVVVGVVVSEAPAAMGWKSTTDELRTVVE